MAEESGSPLPDVPEPPYLCSWLEPVYEAFWRLSKQRARGFAGVEKIRAVDILAYYDAFRPYEDGEEFYHFVTCMDGVFMEAVQEAESKKE